MESPTTDLDKFPVSNDKRTLGDVPVIDITELAHPLNQKQYQICVQSIAQACKDWGFFQIVNHGIQDTLLEKVWSQTRQFFHQPEDFKSSLLRTRENPWGYYNNELTKNQRDKKEVFDYTTPGIDPIYHASNRWPDTQDDFRETMIQYLEACTRVSLDLLKAFCSGLGLPPEFLHPHFAHNHTGFIRLNYYPVKDPLEASSVDHLEVADLGVHHHTDAGALTLLLQDEVGGLQVFREGQWHNISPVAGAIVVNTGDMMQIWSNDTYQAAIHRVLAMQSRDRYSVPFFFNPSSSCIIEPLSTTITHNCPGRYRPVEWKQFRGQRTDGDYADYGTEVQIDQFRKP